jgi:tetratricopeptide (TPR) repeat protein
VNRRPSPSLVLVFLAVLTAGGTSPGWAAAPASLLEQGQAAEAAENYQAALDFYRKAQAADPVDAEASKALGRLFTTKGLHDLALPAWQEAIRRQPGDPTSWESLAQTWAFLDKNAESVKTLQKALDLFPADSELTQALAWMLFKTEDFERGIALVESYLALHGNDASLEMTLGTLYSSVYDYRLSRVHYLKSLDLTRGNGPGDRNFRAIAWYNLSLLEKSFHQYDLADEAIRKSLNEEERPAGSLARGELFQSRRDFASARKLFEKAAATDDTPLSQFDQARLLQQFGSLDEAEALLAQVEVHQDQTWIYNYGVTVDKVSRDLHELRADLHRSRYHALDFVPRTNPWEWVVWAWSKAREGLLWWYHDQTWKSLLVKLAETSQAVRNSPDAWVALFEAHRDRPGLALKYLALARNHELARNPRALASYLVEEGVVTRDPDVLNRALSQLQAPWENEDRERTLAVLAAVRHDQGRDADFRLALAQLYALNPGSLTNHGWGLPVRAALFGDEAQVPRWKAAWSDYTSQTGWEAGGDRPGVAWSLDLRVSADAVAWTLRDPDGQTARSGVVRTGKDGLVAVCAAVYRQVHAAR